VRSSSCQTAASAFSNKRYHFSLCYSSYPSFIHHPLLFYASIAVSNHAHRLPPSQPETLSEIRALQRPLAVNFKSPPQNHTDQLQGKTLLVVGGASGFGEAIVTAFTKQPGTAAIIADNNSEREHNLERTLREAGCSVKFVQVDVTDRESVTGLFRSALSWLKQTYDEERTIDHVVTCAGVIGGQMDFTPVHPDEFLDQKTEAQAPETKSTKISIIGSMYTVSAAMRFGMGLRKQESVVERSDKSIIMLASLAGYSGTPGLCDYTASKWGVRGLWRSLLDDAQVSSSPVRFNLIAPYFVATPLIKDHVPLLESMGIKLANIDDVEAAATRFMCDRSIYGRAAGIWQGGAVDLGDDLGGGNGAAAMAEGVESGALRRAGGTITKRRV
jgi:5'-hydroxyaverantin dehydrogenase